MKEWGSGLGTNAHPWFTVFLLGEIVQSLVMYNFGRMIRVWFTVHLALEALYMGNHVDVNLITIPSEAQRKKWG